MIQFLYISLDSNVVCPHRVAVKDLFCTYTASSVITYLLLDFGAHIYDLIKYFSKVDKLKSVDLIEQLDHLMLLSDLTLKVYVIMQLAQGQHLQFLWNPSQVLLHEPTKCFPW